MGLPENSLVCLFCGGIRYKGYLKILAVQKFCCVKFSGSLLYGSNGNQRLAPNAPLK